jgi:hypothetical protein
LFQEGGERERGVGSSEAKVKTRKRREMPVGRSMIRRPPRHPPLAAFLDGRFLVAIL